MTDVEEGFFKNKEKGGQDMFILRDCDSRNPKSHRKRKEDGDKSKSCILRYKVKRSDGLMVLVCRQAFQEKHYGKERAIENALVFFRDAFRNALGGGQVTQEEGNCEEETVDSGI
ncbi:hypothetical protein ILUMI_25581 [Ignelater luminosus]|uniref:Uncharacterized protein n=1 Tax=Ignelater luminosus TaxID=2038154 RepID=A0A8K0FZI6_IGNLU|nr:hypothetical protein ILUMI_25581 [Ignelater luminosus]